VAVGEQGNNQTLYKMFLTDNLLASHCLIWLIFWCKSNPYIDSVNKADVDSIAYGSKSQLCFFGSLLWCPLVDKNYWVFTTQG